MTTELIRESTPVDVPESPAAATAERPWLPAGAAVVGVAYAVTAHGYGLGTIEQPGPGSLPFAVGVVTALVGTALTALSLLGRTSPSAEEDSGRDGERTSRFGVAKTLLIVVLACVFMIWQSHIIGLLPAVGVGVAVLSWTLRSRVVTAVLTGLGFYLVTFLLFQQWLEVPLPRGYF